ncbi:MAG: proprotein convertase P-domain-containing protein [Saprospiraceae bacterium]
MLLHKLNISKSTTKRFRHKGLLLALVLAAFQAFGQRFNSTQRDVPVPDFREVAPEVLVVDVPVSGLPSRIDEAFGLETVQLAIRHPYVSDVKVELYSPDATLVWIANRNGRDGRDYIEARFSQQGFKGQISEASAPFTGEYIPDGNLAHFNNGQNPNGNWVLKVYDLKAGDTGIFNSVSLFFGPNPAKGITSPCSFSTPKGCVCADGKKRCWLLPDLALNERATANNLYESAFDPKTGKGELRFAVETFNIGHGPLEMRGNDRWKCGKKSVSGSVPCNDGTYARQGLDQTIYGLKNGKLITQKTPAGFIAYDARPGHEHFHFDNYVTYTLLRPVSGEPDPAKWEVVGRGNKASFCLWDLGSCREDLKNCVDKNGRTWLPSNMPNYGLGNYRSCDAALQGLSVGGADLYGENYEGQSLDLPKGTCNGTYWLKIEIDPDGRIREADRSNNTLILKTFLNKQQECQ